MMAVTLYYHRDQAHRSVDLHPVVRHICRFWLWLNTGSSTREWVAVHRKHHAHCEKEGDPHSPRLFGLKSVCSKAPSSIASPRAIRDTLEKYAKGTPNDWLENNLYHHPTRSYYGIALLVVADLVLFGVPGIIMIALQLVEHAVHGGRHRQRRLPREGLPELRDRRRVDESLADRHCSIAGEELHNNHHAFPTSARFSMRRHEVDMGWLHLKVLVWLGLAKVRRVANPPQLEHTSRATTELDELRAIIVHRMHVLRHYTLQRHVAGAAPRARKPRRERELVGARDAPALELAAARCSTSRRASGSTSSRSAIRASRPCSSSAASSSSSGKARTRATSACSRSFASGARAPSRAAFRASQEFVAYLKSFRAMREPALV